MFKFERLCFCTTSNNFEKLGFGKEMPILHLYEILEGNTTIMNDDEIIEGPYILKLIKSDNNGNFPVIYELQDGSFNKERARYKFDWRVIPPGLDRVALDASNLSIHRFYANNCFPEDTDLPGQQFYNKIYSDIDEDITPDKKKDAIHFGNGGLGHYGVNPCCRIKKVVII